MIPSIFLTVPTFLIGVFIINLDQTYAKKNAPGATLKEYNLKFIENAEKPQDTVLLDIERLTRILHTNFDKTSNLLFSPLAIHLLLSAISVGSEGETRSELLSVIDQRSKNSTDSIYDDYTSYIAMLTAENSMNEDENFAIRLTNGIYIRQNLNLQKEFLDTLEKQFLITPMRIDFSNKAKAITSINDDVKFNTDFRVSDMIPADDDQINPLTSLVLTNAFYFKNQWLQPFEASSIKPGVFHNINGSTSDIQTMSLHDNFTYAYSEVLDSEIIKIPMALFNASMVIIAPLGLYGFEEIERKLKTYDLFTLMPRTTDEEQIPFTVTIPKFTLKTKLDLEEILRPLGVNSMFEPLKADFSSMTANSERVSSERMFQEVSIDVNENGIFAKNPNKDAITPDENVDRFESIIDHPFMFYVTIEHSEEDKGILLMGRVVNF